MAREMMINDGSNTQPYHVLRHGNSLSARYMDVVSMGDTLPCKWWNSARTAEMPLKTMALLVPLLYTVKPGKVLGFRLTLRFSISSFQQREEWCRILMMYIEKVMRASQTLQNLCLILGCERAIASTQLGFLNSARCTQQFSHRASNFHLTAVWCDNLGNQSMYHLWILGWFLKSVLQRPQSVHVLPPVAYRGPAGQSHTPVYLWISQLLKTLCGIDFIWG